MTTVSMTASGPAEFRAAGTDLSERRRSGVSTGPLIDLAAAPDTTGVSWGADGAATIGAFTTIATVAGDPRIGGAYPGIAAAALGLATPQIRHLATLGGNLAQRTRCWYFRDPHIACLKKGGSDCPARSGNHLYSVAFDLGPCVAPHPSTMAAALLAYDAKVVTNQRPGLGIGELLGDGSGGTSDHLLAPGEMIRECRAAGAAARRARALQARHQPQPCGVAAGRGLCARSVERWHIPVRAPHRRRHCAGPAPARGVRSRPARQGGERGDDCGSRKTGDRGRKAATDDGIQARPAGGRRARSAGAAGGIREASEPRLSRSGRAKPKLLSADQAHPERANYA